MMAWLNPAALAALAVVTLPILVHLLVRRRAPRVLFPSLRFLVPSDQSAVRIRVPSEWLLLLIRAAIVVCAALAVAQPLLVTAARRDAWAQRTVRAIVVDTSRSVDGRRAAEAAAGESAAAVEARRFEGPDLKDLVQRAGAWLATAPPARREIVVVSDFQRGALAPADLASVPEDIGLRLVRVAEIELPGSFDGDPILRGSTAVVPAVRVSADATTVTFRETKAPAVPIAAPPDVAQRLARVVADAGALAPVDRHAPIQLPAGMPPDSVAAAAFVQASLNGRRDATAWAEREPERVPPSALEPVNRQPSAPSPDAWTRSDESDGRWLWVAAILLMLMEAVIRRRRVAEQPTVEAARAA